MVNYFLSFLQKGPLPFGKVTFLAAWLTREILSPIIYLQSVIDATHIRWGKHLYHLYHHGIIHDIDNHPVVPAWRVLCQQYLYHHCLRHCSVILYWASFVVFNKHQLVKDCVLWCPISCTCTTKETYIAPWKWNWLWFEVGWMLPTSIMNSLATPSDWVWWMAKMFVVIIIV